jgi:hypothetical protein
MADGPACGAVSRENGDPPDNQENHPQEDQEQVQSREDVRCHFSLPFYFPFDGSLTGGASAVNLPSHVQSAEGRALYALRVTRLHEQVSNE